MQRHPRAAFAVALLAAALVAGCTTPTDPDPSPPAGTSTPSRLVGVVHDASLVPIEAATVTLGGVGNTTTDASGRFTFDGLQQDFYIVQVRAAGYQDATASFSRASLNGTVGIEITLFPLPSTDPVVETYHFEGIIQCAIETLIITPSCDTLIRAVNDQLEPEAGRPVPEPFDDLSSFSFVMAQDWKTQVVTVVFDEGEQPGFEGLRVTVRGASDPNKLDTYEQFGRFAGASSFAFRIEPNGNYSDGDRPVPAGGYPIAFDVYPQGHGWHALCDPSGDTCFLGAGAGIDVHFDLFVSQWRRGAAPDGWALS